MSAQKYLTQTPWITFQYAVSFNEFWALLGEAYSKTQHLTGIPLQPALAQKLGNVYLRKGALATTAIEGNTLSANELDNILDNGRELPQSQEYLEQEVRNVIGALEEIDRSRAHGTFRLTPEWIREQNAKILDGLDVSEHVVPGEYTQTQLVVGNYKTAPPQDVPYLVERMCDWINRDYLDLINDPQTPKDQRFYLAFLAAALAHLYIAWIHPFGDGNGRTARNLQVAILSNCGVVPWVSTNLLSDFYNRTRSRYYRALDRASKAGEVAEFVEYSARGYVDLLREQIEDVQASQRRVAWVNYVHEVLHDEASGHAKDRRRDLALAMSEKPLAKRELMIITPALAAEYFNTERMLSRDLTRLKELGLVRKTGRAEWVANVSLMDAFIA